MDNTGSNSIQCCILRKVLCIDPATGGRHDIFMYYVRRKANHVTRGHALGGKTCLPRTLEGKCIIFLYKSKFLIPLGGQNHGKFFIWGAMPPSESKQILI